MIRVVTDSTSDLPVGLREAHGIVVVPLTVRFGDEEFLDGVDLEPAGFWQRIETRLPETAAPSAGAFIDVFTRLADEGAHGVVAVTISSRLSGTAQAAAIAAEQVAGRLPVRVVDSRTVSMALGFAAVAAAETAATGAGLEEVTAGARAVSEQMDLLAVLDTLEYLQRGGRIGRAQALVGGMLDVKPLITVADGIVVPAGRVRTRSKARAALVDRAMAHATDTRLALLHARSEDVDEVAGMIRDHVGDRLVVGDLGPVVATHAGPGALALVHQKV